MHSFTGTIIVFGSSHNLFDISTNLRTFGNECSVAGTQSNVDAVSYYYYYYYYGSLRYFGFWMNAECENEYYAMSRRVPSKSSLFLSLLRLLN